MSSKVKIYTRTGDSGQTSLYGGKRVLKSDQRVHTYGSVDELNSVLGMLVGEVSDKKVREFVVSIQKDLFTIGATLAGSNQDLFPLEEKIVEMEEFIDTLDRELPELKHFILPGGGKAGSIAHLARSVARRAEREIVRLHKIEEVDSRIIRYFNRLSDLLFEIGRYMNYSEKCSETVWQGK